MLRALVFLLKRLHNSGKAWRLLSEAKLPRQPLPLRHQAWVQDPVLGRCRLGWGSQGGDSSWKYVESA